MKLRIVALFVGVVLAATPAGSASAQNENVQSSLRGEARALYDLGRDLFTAGDVSAALGKFSRAHELSGDPRLLWNMAACESALKHYARAMTLVDRYLKKSDPLLSERDRQQAERFRTAAKPLVAVVDLSTIQRGVEVSVDGEAVGTTPLELPLYLDPGKRRIQLTKAGYRGVIRKETVSGGSATSWKVDLERLHIDPLEVPTHR